MKTPIMVAGSTTGPSTTAIRYSPLFGGIAAANWGTNVSNNGGIWGVAGTFSNLRVRIPTLGAGSYIFTLMQAGSASALTCTPDLTGTGIGVDNTNTVHTNGGELFAMKCDPNGTSPTANGHVEFSMLFTADVSGESCIVGGYVASASAGTTFFVPGANDADTTATAASQVWPTGGVLDQLYFRVHTAPGSGKTRTLEIYKNGSATGVTCTISDTATLAFDLTNSVTVAADDLISLAETNTGTPANALFSFSMRWTPTVSGKSVWVDRISSSPVASATRYSPAHGGSNGNQATEANHGISAPVPFVVSDLRVNVVTAPGGSTTRAVTLRMGTGSGQSSTALTKTLTGTTTSDTDSVNSVSVATGDILNNMIVSSASVAATAQMRISYVVYIAPAVLDAVGTTFTLAGAAASLKFGHHLVASGATFALSGTAASPEFGHLLAGQGGAFVLSGGAAAVLYARKLALDGAAFTLTGTAATLKFGRLLAASNGAFVLTGTAANINYGSLTQYTLDAASGEFLLSGAAATLKAARNLVEISGTFALSGGAAALRAARTAALASGQVTLTGQVVGLRAGRRLVGVTGAFALTGAAVDLIYGTDNLVLEMGTAAFVLTGSAAALGYSQTLVAPTTRTVSPGRDSRVVRAQV